MFIFYFLISFIYLFILFLFDKESKFKNLFKIVANYESCLKNTSNF